VKTSFGTSLLSAIYNVIIWFYRKLKTARASEHTLSTYDTASTPATVHLLAGVLASTATSLLAPGERNLLKVFLYMRAVNGFIQLIKKKIESILAKNCQKETNSQDQI
jgi:hypothetical protein